MLRNLLFGLPTMALCLFLQSILVILAMRYYANHKYQVSNASFMSSLFVINSVMLLLVFGNLMQLTIWAVLFVFLGEFDDIKVAIYHSAVNFSTLGYGDIVMSERHRLLGPLQSINGVLMIGVSTAVLMTALQDAMRQTVQARRKTNS